MRGKVCIGALAFAVLMGGGQALAKRESHLGASAASPSLAAAIRTTEQERSGRLTATLSASQGGQSVALVVYRYAFDQPHRLLAVTVDYSKLVALDPSLAAGIKPSDMIFHVIVDGRHHTIYLGSPGFLTRKFQSQLPVKARHREWMKFGAGTLGNVPGLPKGAAQRLLGALTSGPASPLLALQALSTSPSSTKPGVFLGGVATTRYSTTADMAHAGALGQTVLNLAQAAGSEWAALVWVDGSSLIRQVQFTSPPVAQAGNARFIFTCQTQALGSSITIKDPPANEVIPSNALPH
jgi:hypothetical protein